MPEVAANRDCNRVTMKFELLATDGHARRGRVHLNHGVVETPIFMPVGTYGTVKAMTPQCSPTLARIILGNNTFHLWLRPGTAIIDQFKGPARLHGLARPDPHRFRRLSGCGRWANCKITEEGVRFASPVNGDRLFSVAGGVDADPAPAEFRHRHAARRMHARRCNLRAGAGLDADELGAGRSVRRTSLIALENPNALFGIVQGTLFEQLRARFPGRVERDRFRWHAVGGLSVGESKEDMHRILDFMALRMPADKPHT